MLLSPQRHSAWHHAIHMQLTLQREERLGRWYAGRNWLRRVCNRISVSVRGCGNSCSIAWCL